MGLVDYSSSPSSSSDKEAGDQPPAKKQRRTSPTSTTALPPLPASFHDLYAAAVRPAPGDLPSLHQGRRRAVPHVPGNWPSHVYVEWRPPPAEHNLLASLVASLARELTSTSTPTTPTTPTLSSRPAPADLTVTSLLTSDLAAPLPLHVSLSRPFVLRAHERAALLDDLAREVVAASTSFPPSRSRDRDGPATSFDLRVDGLAWHRSPDAARSFLVLRVCSASAAGSIGSAGTGNSSGPSSRNPELAAILARCNACVGARGQPVLYARRGSPKKGGERKEARNDDHGDDGKAAAPAVDEEAFHVSIAWSFAEPTEELRARTAAVFARDEFQRGLVGGADGVRIPVDGVKVKIGNVVTHIALAGDNGAAGRKGGLFGI